MILVTGGTGFVGQVLVRQLASIGKPVRMLIRPSKQSPNLPRGIPVEVALCSLKDERGLRAAMKGVDVTLFDDGRRPDLIVGESLIPAGKGKVMVTLCQINRVTPAPRFAHRASPQQHRGCSKGLGPSLGVWIAVHRGRTGPGRTDPGIGSHT